LKVSISYTYTKSENSEWEDLGFLDSCSQIKILVPNTTAGMIIGKGGNYVKQIKEDSGSYVQLSQKAKDQILQERCITVIGKLMYLFWDSSFSPSHSKEICSF
jgi:hypothetical protein